MTSHLATVGRHDVLEQLAVYGHLRCHVERDAAKKLARILLRTLERVCEVEVILLLGLLVLDGVLRFRYGTDRDQSKKRTTIICDTHVAASG